LPGLVKVAMNLIVMRSGLGPMVRTSSGLLVAGALLAQTLNGCQTINTVNPFAPTFPHGKVALCPSAASIGAAVVVVTDTHKDRPGVQTIPRDTPPEGVCAAVNAAAIDAGFKTVYDDRQSSGVQILASDPDQIKIEAKNVRVVVQDF
jgi:hypothetical protein